MFQTITVRSVLCLNLKRQTARRFPMSKLFLLTLLSFYLLNNVFLIAMADQFYSDVSSDEFAEFDETPDPREFKQFAASESKDVHDAISSSDMAEHPQQQPLQEQPLHQQQSSPSSPKDKLDSAKIEEGQEAQKPELKLVNTPLPKHYTWESYYIEIICIILQFTFFINYFIGSSKNSQLATGWYDQIKNIMKDNFSLVGGPPLYNEKQGRRGEDTTENEQAKSKKQRGLVKITESNYTLWNSGRVGLDGLLVEINLLKRQDLFSMGLTLLRPYKDQFIMRFLLSQEGYDNFVFCLANKSHVQKISAKMVDISTLCSKRRPVSTFGVDSDKMFVLSEITDAASFILDKDAASFIKKYQNYINYIHITDRFAVSQAEEIPAAQRLTNSKRMATFCYGFPRLSTENGVKNAADLNSAEMINFSFSVIDRLRRFKLAKDGKQKSEKNRSKITDIVQKTAFSQQQEAAQARKEEQRRKEKEQMLNETDPEKQRRYELREAKREKKGSKNQGKIKMIMYR